MLLNLTFSWFHFSAGEILEVKMEDFDRWWQIENCQGCRFSINELVGSGKPCCTYPGRIETADMVPVNIDFALSKIKGGICLKREDSK